MQVGTTASTTCMRVSDGVAFSAPVGYGFTIQHAHYDHDIDSDAPWYTLYLEEGEDRDDVDAGLIADDGGGNCESGPYYFTNFASANTCSNGDPYVDLDTDSNNNGRIDGTDAEDQIERSVSNRGDLDGKRIFVNTDDDNVNGKPDTTDGPSQYSDKTDDDFAELALKWGNLDQLGEEYEIWFGAVTGVELHANTSKAPILADRVATYTIQGGDTVKWHVFEEGGTKPPRIAFAEGQAVGKRDVFLRVRTDVNSSVDDSDFALRDTVMLGIETVVWPNQDPSSNWDSQKNTLTWNGFVLGPAWQISVPLVDVINGNVGDIRTEAPISTNFGWEGDEVNKDVASLNLDEMFGGTWDGSEIEVTIEFNFVGNERIATGVYTDVTRANLYKPGFFDNSGVFIAEPGGKMEVQIFDTQAVLDALNDAGNGPVKAIVDGQAVDLGGAVSAAGDVQLWDDSPANGSVRNWTVENANSLITGIPYGYGSATLADLRAAPKGGQTMTMKISRSNGMYTVIVTVGGSTTTYVTSLTSPQSSEHGLRF